MKRTAAHVWTCVLLIWFLKKTDGKTPDVYVTCQYSEDCVLPCSFTPLGREEEIRWFRHDTLIYSHPQSTNWHSELFLGRTSISANELSHGNASLLLQHCVLSDRGRYRCQVTKGEKMDNYFIVLKVEAPIRSVNLEITRLSGYKEFKCSTYNVYPAPHVSWSTDPPMPMENLKYTTRKVANKQGLYTMDSKLKRLGQHSNLTYICTVNSSSSDQTWTVLLTETVQNNVTLTSKLYSFSTWTEINSAEGQDITIPCRSPWNLQNFTLTWSFTRANTSTIICTYDSETQLISNRWNGRAWLEPQRVQEGDGSLRLLSVQSLEHTGMYTCNISTLQRNHVGQTRVNISSALFENETRRMKSSKPWWIPVVIVIAIIIIIAAVIAGIVKLQKKGSQTKTAGMDRYSIEIKVPVNKSEEITEASNLTSDQSKDVKRTASSSLSSSTFPQNLHRKDEQRAGSELHEENLCCLSSQ
ncbi:HERV-H LTR-associating protein 2 [Neoarius graeffei]|uniref:HERV-H LTR-associating protein 2 n=1 Tax=Neoarius graeffei TaxID=443677 RepID=UPI00298CB874|nr:HERV-H LTR-associating protein 2 [Neoarius graeffei]